ncbi:MAG: hypothetical protein ACTHNG_02520 [Ginsengibacter sp.]|jgi:uncharacterized protein YjcR
MLNIVQQYRAIKNNLGEIIKVSGYRNDYIAKKIGMSPQNFAAKKQRNSWNDEEIEKVLAVIDNEDAEDYVLLQLMKSLEDEETISLEEAKDALGWK